MWYRLGIASFLAISLLIFLGVSASLVALFVASLSDLYLRLESPFSLIAVAVSLAAAFLSLISLSFFQFFHHSVSLRQFRRQQGQVTYWMEVFSDVLLFTDEAPQWVQKSAAYALLELSEGIDDQGSLILMKLYESYGFLAEDLRLLGKRISLDKRSRILGRLSLIRHPRAVEQLKLELARPEAVVRSAAFQALARTYSRQGMSTAEVKDIFLPMILEGRFGLGLIEEALVVLGENAGALLYALLEEKDSSLVKLALTVIERSKYQDWASWCLPWLDHELAELRAAALRALAKLQLVPLEASEKIELALADPQWFVRAQAANASIGVMTDSIDDALLKALADQNWWVRHNAAKALKERGSQPRALLSWAAQHHEDRYGRDMAEQILASPV
ncbi:MAG: HEAT repeat domain-containing protein [Trueperaceae bacterium]|nr:HEAT repeat domain-containing protein [Trueperaceae bacterium]